MQEAHCVCNDNIPLYTYVHLLISLANLISSMYGRRLFLKNQFNFRLEEVWVRSHVSLCDIRGKKIVGLWQVVLRIFQFYPLSSIPANLHTHLHLRVAFTRRTNGRSLWTFQEVKFFRKWGTIGWKNRLTFIFSILRGLKQENHSFLLFRMSAVIFRLRQWDTLHYHETILIPRATSFQIITIALRYTKAPDITSVTLLCAG